MAKANAAQAARATPETRATRPRAQTVYIIQRLSDSSDHGEWWEDQRAGELADTAAAVKWLKVNGREDERYRVVAVKLDKTVQAESKRVVRLV